MPAKRVDIKYVRQNANIETVLAHYGHNLKKSGAKPGQYICLCPFHDDEKPSLNVNTKRKIFNCFVCGASGNILDLVMLQEGMGEDDSRPAAIKLAEICNIPTAPNGSESRTSKRGSKGRKSAKPKEQESRTPKPDPRPAAADTDAEELDGVQYNRPLPWTLQDVDTKHPYIAERGISEEFRELFRISVARRGMMAGRLIFPIHNKDGELVAHCGRYIGDDRPDDEPKYKLPGNFRKQLELFNWHRVKAMIAKPVVLVESFFSVVKLHGLGYRVASPMGHALSPEQIDLLLEAGVENVILLFDGDDAGRKALTQAGRDLVDAGIAAVAPCVAADFKPHRASADEFRALLSG